MLVFRKIWRALFSLNTRFEIRPFALLPTRNDKGVARSPAKLGDGKICFQLLTIVVKYSILDICTAPCYTPSCLKKISAGNPVLKTLRYQISAVSILLWDTKVSGTCHATLSFLTIPDSTGFFEKFTTTTVTVRGIHSQMYYGIAALKNFIKFIEKAMESCSGVFIVNFEHIYLLVLVILLLTLSI